MHILIESDVVFAISALLEKVHIFHVEAFRKDAAQNPFEKIARKLGLLSREDVDFHPNVSHLKLNVSDEKK